MCIVSPVFAFPAFPAFPAVSQVSRVPCVLRSLCFPHFPGGKISVEYATNAHIFIYHSLSLSLALFPFFFTQVLKIIPYNVTSNSTFNSTTNLQALRIVKQLLIQGDSEGLVTREKIPAKTETGVVLISIFVVVVVLLLAIVGFRSLVSK